MTALPPQRDRATATLSFAPATQPMEFSRDWFRRILSRISDGDFSSPADTALFFCPPVSQSARNEFCRLHPDARTISDTPGAFLLHTLTPLDPESPLSFRRSGIVWRMGLRSFAAQAVGNVRIHGRILEEPEGGLIRRTILPALMHNGKVWEINGIAKDAWAPFATMRSNIRPLSGPVNEADNDEAGAAPPQDNLLRFPAGSAAAPS